MERNIIHPAAISVEPGLFRQLGYEDPAIRVSMGRGGLSRPRKLAIPLALRPRTSSPGILEQYADGIPARPRQYANTRHSWVKKEKNYPRELDLRAPVPG